MFLTIIFKGIFNIANQFSPSWMFKTEAFSLLFYQGRWKWLERILSSVPGIILLSSVHNGLIVSVHTLGHPLISSGSPGPPMCSEGWGDAERFFEAVYLTFAVSGIFFLTVSPALGIITIWALISSETFSLNKGK